MVHPSPTETQSFLFFPNRFFSLLPEPDLPPALALEIVSRITLANKGGFFIVKSVSKIFDHRKDIEYFKALDLEFAFSPAKLREDQILFHSINDKGTCFQKVHAEQLGMFACIHRNRLNADWRAVDGIKSWRETMKWEALRHWVQLQNLSWREAGHC